MKMLGISDSSREKKGRSSRGKRERERKEIVGREKKKKKKGKKERNKERKRKRKIEKMVSCLCCTIKILFYKRVGSSTKINFWFINFKPKCCKRVLWIKKEISNYNKLINNPLSSHKIYELCL